MIGTSSIRGRSSASWNLRRFHRAGGGLLLGAVLFLASGPLSYGQTTAQLTGTIQDASGAVIPGAQVTLIDEATGASRVVQSNGQGFYAFPSLVPDSYSVKVTASGFQTKELKKIPVHAGDSLTIPPIALAPGAATTTVTVEAVSDMMPTDNGARISVLDS
ncbi:MAG TPA: carboxypeptidase-like regulatory domain-containing protein, partial [Terracidiphilus sp.]